MTKDSVPSGFHVTQNGRIVRDASSALTKVEADARRQLRRDFKSKTHQDENTEGNKERKTSVPSGFHLTKKGRIVRDNSSIALSKAEKERIISVYKSLEKKQPKDINNSLSKSVEFSKVKESRSTIHCFPGAGTSLIRTKKIYRTSKTFKKTTLQKMSTHCRSIPSHIKIKVSCRDKGKCIRCGSTNFLEFDHRKPFSKGGISTYDNIQLLCRTCNRRKSNK